MLRLRFEGFGLQVSDNGSHGPIVGDDDKGSTRRAASKLQRLETRRWHR